MMENIQWKIAETKGAEVGVLGLHLTDSQNSGAIWPYYFTSINIEKYPKAIVDAAQETGSAGEYSGVNFPSDLDEYDLVEHGPLPYGAVEIYHHSFGEIIISRATFYAVLAEFGQRLVERPGQPLAWYAAMQAALTKLRAKMAADAAEAEAAE